MVRKFLWMLAGPLFVLLGSFPAATAALSASVPAPTLTFTQILPRQTIYNWSKTNCSPDHFIPDGPARAFRRADGKFTLIAEEADNWQLVGSNPFDLKASCTPILAQAAYGILNRGYVGIEATYTLDGQTIYGFAGEDLSPIAYNAGCVSVGTGNCWVNDIGAVVSKDMGKSYDFVSSGDGDVAALTHTISTTRTGMLSYLTASNIVKKQDGYYYMFSEVVNTTANTTVVCLLRTNNLADPTSWRGWNGTSFSGILQPMQGSIATPCSHVNGLFEAVYSVQYIPAKHLYVALMQARLQLPGDTTSVPGAYWATSPDLLNWGPVSRLLVTPTVSGYDSQTEIDAYPVLMDPFSKTRNFETIDSTTPVVIYTLAHAVNGSLTLDRDLVAVPFSMK